MAETSENIECVVDCKKRKNLCSASSSSDNSLISTPSPARKLTKTVLDLDSEDSFCLNTDLNINTCDMDVANELKKLSDSLESLSKRVSTLQTRDDANGQMDSYRQDMEKFSTRLSDFCTEFKDRVVNIENRVSDFEDKCDKLMQVNEQMKKDNDKLRKNNDELLMRILHCEREQNDAEQYTRRWNLRLFNVDDQKDETEAQCVAKVCAIFTDKVKVTTTPDDIECCHRLGSGGRGDSDESHAPRRSNNRAIIVRFKPGSRGIRDRILKSRKALKGQSVSIAEDLTKANSELLKVAYKNECCESSWSINGKIFALLKNQIKVRIPFGCNVDDYLRVKMLIAPPPPPQSGSSPSPSQGAVTQSETENMESG